MFIINKIIVFLIDTLKFIFIPFVCAFKGEDVLILEIKDAQDLILKKYMGFEVLIMIDLLFYTYIYCVIFSWTGNIQPILVYPVIMSMIISFWGSAIVGLFIKNTLKNRKLNKQV